MLRLLLVVVLFLLTLAACVEGYADIALVVDGSGSISTSEFSKLRASLKDLVNSFDVSSNGDHIALVLFSTSVSKVVKLTGDKSAMLSQISSMKQPRGATHTHKALNAMRNLLIMQSKGARPGAEKIAMVFTDGGSWKKKLTEIAAKQAKSNGIYIFAIGIGSNIDEQELKQIASEYSAFMSFQNFSALKLGVSSIAMKVQNVKASGSI